MIFHQERYSYPLLNVTVLIIFYMKFNKTLVLKNCFCYDIYSTKKDNFVSGIF